MLLFLALTGVFLSILLIYHNGREFPSSVFLGLFFFCLSIYVLVAYILLFANSYFLIYLFYRLIFIFAPLAYLTGPLFYLYFRSVIQDNNKLYRSDFVHLLPVILIIPLLINAYWPDGSDNADVSRLILSNQINPAGKFRLLISTPFPYIYFAMSRPVLAIIYILLSGGLLLKALRRKVMHLASANSAFNIKWLILLWALFFVATISHSAQIILAYIRQNIEIIISVNVIQIISGAGLVGLLISPFFFPGILYGLPRFSRPSEIVKNKNVTSKSCTVHSGFVKPEDRRNPTADNPEMMKDLGNNVSRFESAYLDDIETRTGQCMKDFKPYLQPEFNLPQLSVLIKVPVHHLAYYFREVKKMSFTDFRNQWRVNHAKGLILEGKSDDLTLEAIGLLSGFASRNTFLNAFKKTEGISPQAFVLRIKKG